MKLTVTPLESLADEAPGIQVSGIHPGDSVVLEVSCTDPAGHRWSGSNTYCAGEDGTVSPDATAPLMGDYEGVDPTGPFWSMGFADERTAPTTFTLPFGPLDFEVGAACGDSAARVTSTRTWDGSVGRRDLSGEGFRSELFLAESSAEKPLVVIVPGSTGPAGMRPVAGLLAGRGYNAAVLSYMQQDGLPSSLREIPLESIHRGIKALAGHPEVDGGRVAVLSYSVGTTVALASLCVDGAPPVAGVVAVAPSSVVWQALSEGGPPPKCSSLTSGGQPLDWLLLRGDKIMPELIKHATVDRLYRRHPRPHALHLRKTYEPGLADSEAADAAAIPVERIEAPLLLLSGADDEMWPASEMAAAVIQRRQEHGIQTDRHIDYPRAGHFIRPPVAPTTVAWNDDLVSGGTPEGSALADRDGWVTMLDTLADWFDSTST